MELSFVCAVFETPVEALGMQIQRMEKGPRLRGGTWSSV